MHYSPAIFRVDSFEAAQRIILTPEGWTTNERWEKETPYLVDLAQKHLGLTSESVVLDYGCGVGRMARELIKNTGCWVIGVDIEPSMRAIGDAWIQNPRYITIAPEALPMMPKCTAALAIWAIQHVENVGKELARINEALAFGAPMLVVNNLHRAIPTNEKNWVNDGVDVQATMDAMFEVAEAGGQLPAEVAPEAVAKNTYWRVYRKVEAGEAKAA